MALTMVLSDVQNNSILIALCEGLVAAPERHEELFAITVAGPGESAMLARCVSALRAHFAVFADHPEMSRKEKLDRLRAIADELQASGDHDLALVGHTLAGAITDRTLRLAA